MEFSISPSGSAPEEIANVIGITPPTVGRPVFTGPTAIPGKDEDANLTAGMGLLPTLPTTDKVWVWLRVSLTRMVNE